jgi:hypothetical protein
MLALHCGWIDLGVYGCAASSAPLCSPKLAEVHWMRRKINDANPAAGRGDGGTRFTGAVFC